jgi:urea transport system permease protein
LYLLAALGLALSFGLMRVINMAHGEMLMLGGYLAYLTLQVVPGPLGIVVAMPVAFVGAALVGALVQGADKAFVGKAARYVAGDLGASLVVQQGARYLRCHWRRGSRTRMAGWWRGAGGSFAAHRGCS